MKKHMLKETNDMRRLMGLHLIKEGKDMMEMENYGDHQERDEYDDRESEVIGVDSDITKQRLQKEDEDMYEVLMTSLKMRTTYFKKEKNLYRQ
jgi:hypothetical protein